MPRAEPKSKHQPQRTCELCRRRGEKQEFCRLVRVDGGLTCDEKRIMPGRGHYLCRSRKCLEAFLTRDRRLGKSGLSAAALDSGSRKKIEVILQDCC